MSRFAPSVVALLAVVLLAASCSGAETIDLEPTTGIAATCEWSPDENVRGDDRWDSDPDALVFIMPARSAGAIITPVDGGFDESPAVAAGDLAVVAALLEQAPAVARIEVQSKEDAYRSYKEIFDSPVATESVGPDDVPQRISVWADPSAESDLSFRSLMWALDARSDVFAVVERVSLCLPGFLRSTIMCGLAAEGHVDIVLFTIWDSSLAGIATEVGSGSIELVDSETTLAEVARLLDIDLFEGRLSTGDVAPSVRVSGVSDPDALVEELSRRFDEYRPFPPTITRPGQGC